MPQSRITSVSGRRAHLDAGGVPAVADRASARAWRSSLGCPRSGRARRALPTPVARPARPGNLPRRSHRRADPACSRRGLGPYIRVARAGNHAEAERTTARQHRRRSGSIGMGTTPSSAMRLFGTEEPVPETSAAPGGAAGGQLRRRQPAPYPDRGPRGDPSDQLHRARPQLGHLRARDHPPAHRAGRRGLPGPLRRGLPGRAAAARLSRRHRGRRARQPLVRGRGRGAHRLRHQPHRLRRAAPAGGRQRCRGRGAACRRHGGAEPVPRADRPDLPVQGHPRTDPRGPAGRAGRLPHGGRRVRDGGPAQLAGCLLQDLCPPAGAALAVHDPAGRAVHAEGHAVDRGPSARGGRAAADGRSP